MAPIFGQESECCTHRFLEAPLKLVPRNPGFPRLFGDLLALHNGAVVATTEVGNRNGKPVGARKEGRKEKA